MPDETNPPPPAPEPQDAAAPSPSEPTTAGPPPEPVAAEPPGVPEPGGAKTSAEVAPEAAATAPAAAGDGTDRNVMSQAELDALMAQAGTVAAPAAAPEPAAATAGNSLSQEELDALIAQAGDNAPTAPRPKMAEPAAAAPPEDPLAAEMAAAIAAEAAAQAAPASEASGPAVIGEVRVPVPPGDPELFEPASLERPAAAPAAATLDLLEDVHLEVKIELGRAQMYIEDVLRLGAGSVVELDKLAGDPVDIYVNDRLIARGEVLVLNDNFCVRINGIESPIPELARG